MFKLLMIGLLLTILVGVFPLAVTQANACDCTSSVAAGEYAPCVGDTVEIYALIQDCYCVPLKGKLVTFHSTRGTSDQIIGVTALTDSNGIARSTITTSTPGESQVYVVVEGIIFGPGSVITWSAATSTQPSTWGTIKAQLKE